MTSTDPVDVVRTCLGLMQEGRAVAALDLLDPDVEWRNSGYPTLRGPRAHAVFRALEERGVDFAVTFHHVGVDVDDPEVVLTDRTDALALGRFRAEFWVCGTFRVRAGRIVLWDDRFSTGNVVLGALRGLGRAVLP
jgi:limonene-1,2-epoxide hydrolase